MSIFKKISASKISIAKRKPVFGVGINDAEYIINPTVNGKQTMCPAYRRWINMLSRCFDEKYLEKNPTYAGCTVVSDWLLFSNFAKWIQSQPNWKELDLDKDLIFRGNKVYSPKLCMMVPQAINKLLNDCGRSRGKYPLGVCFNKKRNKFIAKCKINGSQLYIGQYSTQKEAHLSYLSVKAKAIRLAASRIQAGYDTRITKRLVCIANEVETGRYYK